MQPRKGSAVWWPHGMEHNLWEQDDRTHHEAMPVVKGVKKVLCNSRDLRAMRRETDGAHHRSFTHPTTLHNPPCPRTGSKLLDPWFRLQDLHGKWLRRPTEIGCANMAFERQD